MASWPGTRRVLPAAGRLLLDARVAASLARLREPGTPWAAPAARARASAAGIEALCDGAELARRDAAVARSRSEYEACSGRRVTLGDPLDRQMYVANLRTADGRRRVPKLMMLDSERHRWMSLTEDDFEAIVKLLPKIKAEIVKYKKKLS
mmetsp:Transcript_109653/g.338488  ORF Transcript_109653/g.338488 Transcript_109653/m.338488 type:complete len:150 (-) Transcript_109653:84-533(-)|eukprot:CAMPEP_0175537086 /NCGR_PEP_ID=MMETSP0096-20121207/25036_1 /TAXON_ID=311494 /ORGANISM="Alexandrium monilatum, Strain CCMP3105" /LENGTH=149 /DNA_ID=CAMNT_0016839909 /DNA_START=40 /DNA_END=489 /DNA_ORIENTATION=-